jgi:hypothetical protein
VHGLAAVAPGSGATSSVVLVVFLIIGIGAYFIPGIIASARHVPNQASVWIINIFLGWSLIGWVVALAMAARSQPPLQQVIVRQGWQHGQGTPSQAPPGFQPYGGQQPQQWSQAQPEWGQQPAPEQPQPWVQGQ